ncbi:NAD+-dependent protein deacetylase SIR2 [Geosmithia morbida]|uniref:NAD-dependent protein deacetylase n=1 Tax=Geosmithia morbida TaxID=1094350 RepID=A0A9P5D4J3_9HYPO|nr:NAD+-dependent protein deacetylase SIR2 [Geosmithia morbida]KAF4122855.1 NAD+-dependent protein deacetylase SIR2 [Geosmithia morbida]
MGQDSSSMVDDSVPPATLSGRKLSSVAEYIKSGKPRRIVVLTGAGISTAAGIPDFRSPGTGLYANLARLKLPYAEAVFDISFFRENPEPFYVLARELYPGRFHPTVSHVFIALLARKGLLDFLFTQNIDCLERQAGVPSDLIVEAHGSFATQRCIECKKEFPAEEMRQHVDRGEVPRCHEDDCNGLVKPDIVFFGESLPREFDRQAHVRMENADLVLVVGTSLSVYPFAALPDMADPTVPRLLFNLEQVGSMGSRADDVLELGDCDSGIRKLADELGWRDELESLWREVVGEDEAERQIASHRKGKGKDAKDDGDVEDEVAKLTREVDVALHLEDKESEDEQEKEDENESKLEKGQTSESKAEVQTQGTDVNPEMKLEAIKPEVASPRKEIQENSNKI